VILVREERDDVCSVEQTVEWLSAFVTTRLVDPVSSECHQSVTTTTHPRRATTRNTHSDTQIDRQTDGHKQVVWMLRPTSYATRQTVSRDDPAEIDEAG